MRSSSQGIVLIAVMIFLQIFTLLGLYALENLMMQGKWNNAFFSAHQLENQTENALRTAEEHYSLCIVPPLSIQELKNKSLTDWKTACRIGEPFYYITELLGEDPCSGILPDKKYSAKYYRISLLGIGKGNHILLQSIQAINSGQLVHCKSKIRAVTLGRQEFREIV